MARWCVPWRRCCKLESPVLHLALQVYMPKQMWVARTCHQTDLASVFGLYADLLAFDELWSRRTIYCWCQTALTSTHLQQVAAQQVAQRRVQQRQAALRAPEPSLAQQAHWLQRAAPVALQQQRRQEAAPLAAALVALANSVPPPAGAPQKSMQEAAPPQFQPTQMMETKPTMPQMAQHLHQPLSSHPHLHCQASCQWLSAVATAELQRDPLWKWICFCAEERKSMRGRFAVMDLMPQAELWINFVLRIKNS